MKTTNGVTLFAMAMFIPVFLLGILNIIAPNGVFVSSILHNVSMVVVLLCGVFAWYGAIRGFYSTGSMRLLLIGSGLLAGAILLLSHGFYGGGSVGDIETGWFERLGLLVLGVFLFLTIGFTERTIAKARRHLAFVFSVAVVVLLVIGGYVLTRSAVVNGTLLSVSAGLWTPLGRFFQIASIMFLTVAAIRYLHGAFLIRSEAALAFATGIVLLVMSELSFGAARQVFDSFFWLAHLWMVAGFLGFLWGTAVAGQARHEVAVVEEAADHRRHSRF